MSKLILKGSLAKKYGSEHNVKTDNLSEAIRIVDANFHGFKTSFQHSGEYAVFRNDENIGEEKLLDRGTFDSCWIIEPVPYGSKSGGFLQAVLGVVLIVVGAYFPPAAEIGTELIVMGVGMAIGGLASFLAPTPSSQINTSELEEEKSSYLFNGPTNKTQPGHARAICCGEVFCSTVNVGYSFDHIDLLI